MKKIQMAVLLVLTVLLTCTVYITYSDSHSKSDFVLNAESVAEISLNKTDLSLFRVEEEEIPKPEEENQAENPAETPEKILSQEDISVSAKYAIVYNASDKKILYLKGGEDEKIYPASITKVFSAFVALQYVSPDDVVTAGNELDLVQAGSSLAYIAKGQRLTVRTLIYGMLLPSGNDAAYVLAAAAGRAIAEKDSISAKEAVSVFVEEMNRMAQFVGMENSSFTSPDGFHDDKHYTTLSDIAGIAGYIIEDETIAECVKTRKVTETYVSGQKRIWKNTNLLLEPSSRYYCENAVGIKTGYTKEAGNCLLSAFEKDGKTYIIGVFGCRNKYSRFADAKRLFEEAVK